RASEAKQHQRNHHTAGLLEASVLGIGGDPSGSPPMILLWT
ncbi:MAG: hypothetical protein QOE51_460, partial [Actinoplanes sp.]|nr:hypothetical protein [Actinoplanes sp.]